MKKYLIALTIAVAAATTGNAIQQNHRHTPRTAVSEATAVETQEEAAAKQSVAKAKEAATGNSDTQKKKATKEGKKVAAQANTAADTSQNDGIEAYSDTSAAPLDSSSGWYQYSYQTDFDDEDFNMIGKGLSSIIHSMFGTLLILFIIFVIAPVAILFIILYFAYKNRKQKLRLAEMAIKNGQPAPDILGNTNQNVDDILWRKGIKNIFVGIGLMFLFGFMGFDTGIGIGFLVMFYGAGQAVIARTSPKNRNDRNHGTDAQDPEQDI